MHSTIHYQIGLRLRKFRRQQRRSQRELSRLVFGALHAPISRDMIANWETGRAAVLADYIPVEADVLQVEVADILPRLTLKNLKAGQIMPTLNSPRRRWQQA